MALSLRCSEINISSDVKGCPMKNLKIVVSRVLEFPILL